MKTINIQPSEPVVNSKDVSSNVFDVHSIFHTIQGEGVFCGTPAVFIRLAGCNLQCEGCDTEYTQHRHSSTSEDILSTVRCLASSGKTRLVVITGGEPFRQRNLSVLFKTLTDAGYYVQVETNGSLPPTEWAYNLNPSMRRGVYIVVSPKTPKVNRQIWLSACCAKYVLKAGDCVEETGLPRQVLDSTFAQPIASPPTAFDKPIYLQPMDCYDKDLNVANLKACIDSCMKHGHVLQLQIHKIINME